jgi:hypothetical protein
MKSTFFNGLLAMLSLTLMSSMCSSDDMDNPNNNSQQIMLIENTAVSGSWTISSYVDSGQDETNDYNGYTFTFNDDGTVVATNGGNTINGTWSVTDSSNSNDDSNSVDDIDFNISFSVPTTSVFYDLNDDWEIVTYSNNTISLIDISGGNGGTDTLVFTKN